MNKVNFMVSGVNVGLAEIMLILLGLFVVLLVVRNVVLQRKKPNV
ncbi:MAG: hypothetical protein V4594_08855 [Bacteroidota bacterium]